LDPEFVFTKLKGAVGVFLVIVLVLHVLQRIVPSERCIVGPFA
jgi:hypothetical protein